jgi:gluconolactonase
MIRSKMKNSLKSLYPALVALLATAAWNVLAADAPKPESNELNLPVTAPGAKLELLADGFKFTEGPACDKDGNVYFTDQPNDRILKWSVEGKLTTFLQPAGRANGLAFDGQASLFACADEKNQLWSIDMNGKATVLLEKFEGKLFNGPNDLWIHPSGRIYFTDPYYKRDYWKRGPKEMDEHVYLLEKDRKTCVRLTEDLKQPNGIVGTPDGKRLYVADIGAGKTYVYDIQPDDGRPANKRLFAPMGSDGMTLDEQENVYLTGKGVTVFDKEGTKLGNIPVPKGWTANVTFGGKDRKTLFITAMDSFYSVPMRVKGY